MKRASMVLAVIAQLLVLQHAQAYPDRPIKLVVPSPAGSPPDQMARLVSDKMSANLGQPVIVDNRAGGAGGTVVVIDFMPVAERVGEVARVQHDPPGGIRDALDVPGDVALGPGPGQRVGLDRVHPGPRHLLPDGQRDRARAAVQVEHAR